MFSCSAEKFQSCRVKPWLRNVAAILVTGEPTGKLILTRLSNSSLAAAQVPVKPSVSGTGFGTCVTDINTTTINVPSIENKDTVNTATRRSVHRIGSLICALLLSCSIQAKSPAASPRHCWECRIAFVVSCIGSFFGWQTLAQCIIGRLDCYFLRRLLMAQCRDRSAREIGAGGPGFSGSFRFSTTTSLRRAPYRRDSPQPACYVGGDETWHEASRAEGRTDARGRFR